MILKFYKWLHFHNHHTKILIKCLLDRKNSELFKVEKFEHSLWFENLKFRNIQNSNEYKNCAKIFKFI